LPFRGPRLSGFSAEPTTLVTADLAVFAPVGTGTQAKEQDATLAGLCAYPSRLVAAVCPALANGWAALGFPWPQTRGFYGGGGEVDRDARFGVGNDAFVLSGTGDGGAFGGDFFMVDFERGGVVVWYWSGEYETSEGPQEVKGNGCGRHNPLIYIQ